jgi:hypothetical protein
MRGLIYPATKQQLLIAFWMPHLETTSMTTMGHISTAALPPTLSGSAAGNGWRN